MKDKGDSNMPSRLKAPRFLKRISEGLHLRPRAATLPDLVSPQFLAAATGPLHEHRAIPLPEEVYCTAPSTPQLERSLESRQSFASCYDALAPAAENVAHNATEMPKVQVSAAAWNALSDELKLEILSWLSPTELIRASRVNSDFRRLCLDGQLWTRLDSGVFGPTIPLASYNTLVKTSAPFLKDAHLTHCVHDGDDAMPKNLIHVNLEHSYPTGAPMAEVFQNNGKIVNLNLTGHNLTPAVVDSIGQYLPCLQILNVNWCSGITGRGLSSLVNLLPDLRHLHASGLRGVSRSCLPLALHHASKLETLVLSNSSLTSNDLAVIMCGLKVSEVSLRRLKVVVPRELRHLSLSGCRRLCDAPFNLMHRLLPKLQGLQLNNCSNLTEDPLGRLIAATPHLTHLELDRVRISDRFLSETLTGAQCRHVLKHLSVSGCDIKDSGIVSILQHCSQIESIVMDNTRVTNFVLAKASDVVTARSRGPTTNLPRIGLRLDVFDCYNITWDGVATVLESNNSNLQKAVLHEQSDANGSSHPVGLGCGEIVALKCYHDWQMLVDLHTRYVLAGRYNSAKRLHHKWVAFMKYTNGGRNLDAKSIALARGSCSDPRDPGFSRRRAKTVGPCTVM